MKEVIKGILILCALFFAGCAVEAGEQVEGLDQALIGGLQINEVKLNGGKFIEVFNAGTASVNLTSYKVVAGRSDTGVDLSTACALSGTIAPGGYVVKTSADCPSIPWTDPDYNSAMMIDGPVRRTYDVLNGSNVSQENLVLPQRGAWPLIGMSYSACPNGSDTFCSAFPTQGSAN